MRIAIFFVACRLFCADLLVQGAIEPQAVLDVPAEQVPPFVQQNPAPHAPASQLAVQDPAVHVGVPAPHEVQANPLVPHADDVLPATHVLPLQHPPLHASSVEHVVEHIPVSGSQA